MKKMILCLLSLLVIGMFLVGCAKSGAEGLAGEAVKLTPKIISKTAVESAGKNIELLYRSRALVANNIYTVHFFNTNFDDQPSLLNAEEYKKLSLYNENLNDYLSYQYQTKNYPIDVTLKVTGFTNQNCNINIDGTDYTLKPYKHYNLTVSEGILEISIVGNDKFNCYLKYLGLN